MIKKASFKDMETLSELMRELWPHHTKEELLEEVRGFVFEQGNAYFLDYEGDEAAGFAHASLRRDYVEGTDSSPVGYLEGIYVKESYRSRGIARALLRECELWAREKGCTEFASDCELTNAGSEAFHKRLGFEEANRIICFRKDI